MSKFALSVTNRPWQLFRAALYPSIRAKLAATTTFIAGANKRDRVKPTVASFVSALLSWRLIYMPSSTSLFSRLSANQEIALR